MASSLRQRPPSQIPKAPTSLSPDCVIADTAVLTGAHLITISAHAIIHPRARIVSTWGPVTIGEGCIVSEKASVGRLSPAEEGGGPAVVGLDQDVVVEPAALVEGQRIGQGCTLEAGSRVCAGVVLGKYCKVAALCSVSSGEVLDDFTIVFGNNQRRKERQGLERYRKTTHDMELATLRKLIPSNRAKWHSET